MCESMVAKCGHSPSLVLHLQNRTEPCLSIKELSDDDVSKVEADLANVDKEYLIKEFKSDVISTIENDILCECAAENVAPSRCSQSEDQNSFSRKLEHTDGLIFFNGQMPIVEEEEEKIDFTTEPDTPTENDETDRTSWIEEAPIIANENPLKPAAKVKVCDSLKYCAASRGKVSSKNGESKDISSEGIDSDNTRCPHCTYKTKHVTTMRRHIMRVHTKEKPFKCPVCPYASVQKAHVKVHMKTHWKGRILQCPTCPHRAHTKTDLSRHESKVHGKKLHPENQVNQ